MNPASRSPISVLTMWSRSSADRATRSIHHDHHIAGREIVEELGKLWAAVSRLATSLLRVNPLATGGLQGLDLSFVVLRG
jgi:hypothetical protein